MSKIEMLKSLTKEVKDDLKEYVQDKSISLENRWNRFVEEAPILNLHGNYYFKPKGINWNKHTLFDDFHTDRHQYIDIEIMLETALEKDLFEEGGEELFKEYFLEKFIYSFENDW